MVQIKLQTEWIGYFSNVLETSQLAEKDNAVFQIGIGINER